MPRRQLERSGVPDPDAAVADTHALIFHAAGGRRLGARAARLFHRCESGAALRYVPVAVMWEFSVLARVGRITIRQGIRDFFEDLFSNPSYQPLDLAPDHIYAADALTFTRDPFDALIVAAAQIVDLPLVTRDAAIEHSRSVAVIW